MVVVEGVGREGGGSMCGGEGIITRRQARPGLPAVQLFSRAVTTAIDIPSRSPMMLILVFF